LKHGFHVYLLPFRLLSEQLLLSLCLVALEPACQHVAVRLVRGTDALAPAFLPVVAKVAIASVRQSSPWVSVTAAEERSASFSAKGKEENPRRQ